MRKSLHNILVVAVSLLLFHACATINGASGNMRTYSNSFESVNDMVNKAIGQTKLNIDDVAKAKGKKQVTYTVSTVRGVGKTQITQENGKVIVRKMTNGVIEVEVVNPEYHYTVPEYQREDYKRILMPVFDKLMEPRSDD